MGTSLVAHLGLGLGAGLLFAAIGPWTLPTLFNTPDHLIRPLRIAIVVFGVQLAADLLVGGCQAVLDGFQRVDRSRAVEIVRRTLFGGATAGAAVVTERLDAVAIAPAVAAVISATIGVVVARRTTRGYAPRYAARPSSTSCDTGGKCSCCARWGSCTARSTDSWWGWCWARPR